MSEHGGDFGAGVFADAAGVLCKKYIQSPVQAVLDPPMTADGAGEAFDAERQAAQIIMGFELLAAFHDAAADDHADGLRGPPATESGRTLRHGEQIIAAYLGAAPLLLAFNVFDKCRLQTGCGLFQCLLERLANLGVKRGLVVLHGQNVIGFAFNNAVGDFGLTAPPPLRVGAGRS